MSDAPSVLFVCVKNGGKSQMAAALMRQCAGSDVRVASAGTAAGTTINGLSAEALAEWGIDIAGNTPQQITDGLIAAADRIVVLGREAVVDGAGRTPVEVWDTDEPSERGIEGIERMRIIRDDIAARAKDLAQRLASGS